MNEAKKLYDNKPEMKVPKDKNDEQRLEQRYLQQFISDYKLVATSSIRQANTSQLESLVDSIRKEEFSQDTVLDTVLSHASSMLDLIGYTTNLIQSRSKRELKKLHSSFGKQISETENQLANFSSTITQIDNYINDASFSLDEYHSDLSQKSTELKVLKKEISDYKTFSKNSLDPNKLRFLEQGELDFQLKKQSITDLENTCDISFLTIQDYYSQKSQSNSMKSLFEGEKILLHSLRDKVSLELEQTNYQNPIETLSRNRLNITSAYKIQEKLLNTLDRFTKSYNRKVSSLPSVKKMSEELRTKRMNYTSIKR